MSYDVDDKDPQPAFDAAKQQAYRALKEPIQLIPTKPDKDLAIELKAELAEAAQSWMDACTKAHRCGFGVQANFGPDAFGKYVIHTLNLIKTF